MPISKPSGSGGGGGRSAAPLGGWLKELTPTLLEYLSETQYDDGSPRQTATLTVFVETGVVKLCLNDRDLGRTAWVTSDSLENAIAAMEGRLADGSADWRSTSGGGRRPGRK